MKYLIVLTCGLFMLSCASVLGLKKNATLTVVEVNDLARSYNIERSFIVDTSYFANIENMQNEQMRKHHSQPLQALYFDKDGKNLASLINCNAAGLANLHWEKAGIIGIFPPRSPLVFDTISLSTILRACNLTGKINSLHKPSYTVLIFWNKFMGRQTKRFLTAIRKNLSLSHDQNIEAIYINNDNLYSGN